MSEWAPPASTSAQQYPRAEQDGWRRLLNRVGAADQQARDIRNNLLKTAGVRVEKGLLRILGSLVIEGDLSVPNGKIKNDWLESPIAIDLGRANVNAFTLTPTATDFASFTIPIPAGYSRALVKSEAMAFAYNDTAAGDYFYVRIFVDSPVGTEWSRQLLGDLNVSSGCSLTVTNQEMFEGLDGGTLTVRLQMKTAFASIVDASNGATVTSTVWFLR